MKRTVLFTGAGASKAFGFPITSEIFPAIAQMIEDDELFGAWKTNKHGAKSRKRLKAYLKHLLPGYRPGRAKSVSVTQLLSMIDYAIISGLTPMPAFDIRDLQDLRGLLEWAITEALWWPSDETHPDLATLTRWFYNEGKQPGRGISFISTNYDYSFEEELFEKYKRGYRRISEDFDFGFNWRHPAGGTIYRRPTLPKYQVYKLHGSLNWARCGLCNHVYVNVNESPIYQIFGERVHKQSNACDCEHWPLLSLLVAPSFVRDVRDANLLSIWDAAFESLRRADRWIMVGYSLPPEDVAIRSLLLRAYQSRRAAGRKTHIEVHQLCDAATEENYKLLFPDCDYRHDGMAGLVKTLPQPAQN